MSGTAEDCPDPRASALVAPTNNTASLVRATLYVGDQLARIATVIEEAHKPGGTAHAIPSAVQDVVSAVDAMRDAVARAGEPRP